MPAHNIAERPDLDQQVSALPLYLSGTLPAGMVGQAYDGRLAIHNAIGTCSVEQTGGDILPAGHQIYVDQDSDQVVVAWPAYQASVQPLQNPGFEAGNVSGWTIVYAGGTGNVQAATDYRYEGSYSLKFTGGAGLGSEGGIECLAVNDSVGPALPQQYKTGSIRGMYNPGGHNFGCRYQARLLWLNSGGSVIGQSLGPEVKGRGNNGDWVQATVGGYAPEGTKGFKVAGWLTSKGPPTWMDSALWSAETSVGVNATVTYNISLIVRDSTGRSATWSGSITVRFWNYDFAVGTYGVDVVSQPYTVHSYTDDPTRSRILALCRYGATNGPLRIIYCNVGETEWHLLPNSSFTTTDTRFVFVDSQGNIWTNTSGLIYKSPDGGASWVTYTPWASGGFPQTIFETSAGRIWVNGTPGWVVVTDNYGTTWNQLADKTVVWDLVQSPVSGRVTAIHISAGNMLVTYSDDNMATWNAGTLPGSLGLLNCLAALPTGEIALVASGGGLYVANDGATFTLRSTKPVHANNVQTSVVHRPDSNVLVAFSNLVNSGLQFWTIQADLTTWTPYSGNPAVAYSFQTSATVNYCSGMAYWSQLFGAVFAQGSLNTAPPIYTP